MTEKIKIFGLTSNMGFFFRVRNANGYHDWEDRQILDQLKFDGSAAKKTYNKNWVLLAEKNSILEVLKKGPVTFTNQRWVLVDPTLQSDQIPLELSFQDVGIDRAHDDWINHTIMRSLYQIAQDEVPPAWFPIEFEIELVHENVQIEKIDEPVKMFYKVPEGRKMDLPDSPWDASQAVSYADLEKALTPEFLLHMRPCTLPSQALYKIIRRHVQDNIDPAVSVITSDYDFCFTVSKKVRIQPWQKEIKKYNGRSYRPPKFQTVTESKIVCFEMTDSKHKYNSYPVLEGITAPDLKTLVDHVKTYLDDLMEFINIPVTRCENCNGCGHTFPKNFKLNKAIE